MRLIKQLPPIAINREDYDFLEATCRRLLEGARRVAADGTALELPDTEGRYPACWTRDFCCAVEGAGRLLTPAEILGAIDYLLARQREDGVIPERVRPDGVPVYLAGPEDQPLGLDPPTDNAQFMVKLLDAYYVLTGDGRGFVERSAALARALESVPLNVEGLVYVDRNRPHAAYGFTDCVAKSGKELFSTLLYWEATRRLALRLQELEEHEEARIWFEAADLTIHQIPQLYDPEARLFWAASEDCRQYDLWGTVYAVVMRVASKTQSRLIGEFLLENRERVFWRGHMRHLLKGEYWEKLLVEVPRDSYQNGAYWAVPAGWAAQTVALVDPEAARGLISEVLSVWREEDVYECISPAGEHLGPGYVASAANLLADVTPR
jgi:hypothetical protein